MRSTTKSDRKPNRNKVIEITQSLEKCERGFVIAAELTVLRGWGARGMGVKGGRKREREGGNRKTREGAEGRADKAHGKREREEEKG